MSFQINIDPAEYESQISTLDARIKNLQELASQYANMKTQAENAWGSEDANLAKAQKICDTAISAINNKIEAAQGGLDAIKGILEAGNYLSSESSSGLDAADASIQALLH